MGDLDLETVTLVVLVANLVVGIPEIVTGTVLVINTLSDLVMETVLEVVNERLGVIVLDFKGLFVIVENLVVGIGETVKVRVVVTEGDAIKLDEPVRLRVRVESGLLVMKGEYDANKVGL